jgi:hypothetical protein
MTHRERMLAAIGGEPCDRLPYAPRLDLWYRANRRAGTLPVEYRNATLEDILEAYDLGYHTVIPPLKDIRSIDDEIDRGIGIYNIRTFPHRTVLENIERRYHVEGSRTLVEYETPYGSITTEVVYDVGMEDAGITISHVASHAFKSVEDYIPLGYIFENASVEDNYEGYEDFHREIGDRGIAVCYVNFAASAMQYIMRDLMPLERFFFEINDHPKKIKELAQKIDIYHSNLLEKSLGCPEADVFFLGSHYDGSITYPAFFREHILPTLKSYSEKLHARGKYLLSHTDGENMGLLQFYPDAGIDIADSITPRPMTNLSYREVKEFFSGRITIMGGIPSIALLPLSMPSNLYEELLDEFFEALGRGDHAILGISDTTPPDADFDRILRVKERIERFGRVPGVA